MEMPNSTSRKLQLLIGVLLTVGLVAVIVTSNTQARASASSTSKAHAATAAKKTAARGPSFMTGIGDEQPEMFSNPLWRQLHTKIVRYIAPYDAATREYSLLVAEAWIHAAEAQHQQVMVAFYHSEYTPTKMPSVALYKRDVAKFIKIFPHVRIYQSWDESNRGNVRGQFSSPSAGAAARYYQALKRDCTPCTVIGLDILDADVIGPTLQYIAEFKHEIYHLKTLMPSVWGLHNYSDVNRLESWRTHDIVKALGGEVWLTETGGIVKFGGAFPNKNGSGLSRAARVLQFVFKIAASEPRIKRLYLYDWTGGTSKTRFDAGLMNYHDQPRQGYVVVCKQLRAAKCNVKVVKN
ncbi:MAG TPA: hypothetical protein VGL37_07325 [Solirubrobacteraceae bacterium]|jgi:hypothetical protein